MAAISNFLENELLDHVLRNSAYTPPTTVYVALFTGSASLANLEAGTLTGEFTGAGYARQAVTFAVAAGGATSNSGAVNWTNMPAGVVTYGAVMDASTGGNVLFYGALQTARTLEAGDSFTLNAGELDVTMD